MCALRVDGSPEPGLFGFLQPQGPLSAAIIMPAPAPSKTEPRTTVLLGTTVETSGFRQLCSPGPVPPKHESTRVLATRGSRTGQICRLPSGAAVEDPS